MGASLLFAVQSMMVAVIVAAVPVHASLDCEYSAGAYDLQVDEMARFFVNLKAMPETTEKAHNLVDLKKKFKQMKRAGGERFLLDFQARIEALGGVVLQGLEQEQKKVEESQLTQKEMLRGARSQRHTFDYSPSTAVFAAEREVLVATNGQVILHNLDTKKAHSWTVIGADSQSTIKVSHTRKAAFVITDSEIVKLDLVDFSAKPIIGKIGRKVFVTSASVSANDEFIAIGNGDGTSGVYRTSDLTLVVEKIESDPASFKKITFSDSGRFALARAKDLHILFDLAQQKVLPGINDRIFLDAAFVPGKEQIGFISRAGKKVYHWDLNLQTVTPSNIVWPFASGISYSKDGKTVILTRQEASDNERNLVAFNAETGADLQVDVPTGWRRANVMFENRDKIVLLDRDPNSQTPTTGIILDKSDLTYSPINVKSRDYEFSWRSDLSPSYERFIVTLNPFDENIVLEVW